MQSTSVKALRLRTILMDGARRRFETIDTLMLPAGNAASKMEEATVGSDVPRDSSSTSRPDSFRFANLTGISLLLVPCAFSAFDEAAPFRIGHAYQIRNRLHKRTAQLQ